MLDVYIGQQMDVYLRAVPPSKAVPIEFAVKDSRLPFEEQPAANHPVRESRSGHGRVPRYDGSAAGSAVAPWPAFFRGSSAGTTLNFTTWLAGDPLAISSCRIRVRL